MAYLLSIIRRFKSLASSLLVLLDSGVAWLGKIENCQDGVYLDYVSSKGHAIVDTDLYLPKELTSDKQRVKRAGIPKEKQHYRNWHETMVLSCRTHG